MESSIDIDIVKWEKLAETIPLDMGGHFKSGAGIPPEKEAWLRALLKPYLALVMLTHKSEWKKLPCFADCYDCGENITLQTNGDVVRCTSSCPFPLGHGELVFELNVPSGKMAVANDLRDVFRVVGDYDVNGLAGIFKTTEAYSQVGMAHCFVGNTMPGVFRVADDSFVVGTSSRQNRNPVKGSRRVAGICTDLWWYSICDHAELLRRAKNVNVDVVSCKPGVYRFRHVYHLTDHSDYKSAQVYSYIDWVREPDPVRDYAAAYNALNLTAGQIVRNNLKTWHGDKTNVKSIMDAAGALMCHGGHDYHPNGFWASDPGLSNSSPTIKIPVFNRKHRWYPFGSSSVIGQIAGLKCGFLAPVDVVGDSFIELAFNICRSIILYGAEWMDGHEKSTIRMAKKCMKALKKRYPTKIPKNCQNV